MSNQPFQLNIGKFTCYVIQDDTTPGGSGILAPNADISKLEDALITWGNDPKAVAISYNCLFIDTGDHKILIDAGGGEGDLLPNLASIGIQPADIDTVILSHGHGDHYGGMTDGEKNLTFPNAEHVAWQKEWDNWTNDAQMAEFEETEPARADQLRTYMLPLRSKLRFVDDAHPEILTGITAIPAYGHTAGHIGLLIESEGETLLFVGDAFLHPVHIQNLDWHFGMDADHDQARQTRVDLLELADAKNATIVSYHFRFPGAGHALKMADGWDWKPIE